MEILLDYPNIKLSPAKCWRYKTAGIIPTVQICCPYARPAAAPGAQFTFATFILLSSKKGGADAAGEHSTAFLGDAAPPKLLPHH